MPRFEAWKRGNPIMPGDKILWIVNSQNSQGENIKLKRNGFVIAISTIVKRGHHPVTVAIVYINTKSIGGDFTILFPLDEYGEPREELYNSHDPEWQELRRKDRNYVNSFSLSDITSKYKADKIDAINRIREITMNYGYVDYFQKQMVIHKTQMGDSVFVSVQFKFRKVGHSLVRSAPLNPIKRKTVKKPVLPKPKSDNRIRVYSTNYMRNKLSYMISPEHCRLVSDIPTGMNGIIYFNGNFIKEKVRGMFNPETNSIYSIEENIFKTDNGKEYYIQDKRKMEIYVPPRPPPPPPPPPSPLTWCERNQHLYRFNKDPIIQVNHQENMSFSESNKYAIGDIFSSSDNIAAHDFIGLMNGSNKVIKYAIVVELVSQKRKSGSKFPESTMIFPIFAEYKGVVMASSSTVNKVLIGDKSYRNYPLPLVNTRFPRTVNVSELFSNECGDMLKYTFKKPICLDKYKDSFFNSKMHDIEYCYMVHPKKTSICGNKVDKVHPISKKLIKTICSKPHTPNTYGMCEGCHPVWKEPQSGCTFRNCCGPYALGKTYDEYKDSLLFTNIDKCIVHAASAFNNNICCTEYA